jgi:hypothetical protein
MAVAYLNSMACNLGGLEEVTSTGSTSVALLAEVLPIMAGETGSQAGKVFPPTPLSMQRWCKVIAKVVDSSTCRATCYSTTRRCSFGGFGTRDWSHIWTIRSAHGQTPVSPSRRAAGDLSGSRLDFSLSPFALAVDPGADVCPGDPSVEDL